MWKPDLSRGEDRAVVNATFLAEVERYRLVFQCPDCAFVAPDGSCVTGWPNARLMRAPIEALDADGEPAFCKSFEADGM
jgi:hypothetical protein